MTGGGESWLSWVFKFVNFALLVGVLVKFGGKPLKDYLENRHKAIKEKLEEAGNLLREAEKLKREYEARLVGLGAEIDAYKKMVLEETETEKEKILDEASQFASRMREQAKLTFEQETKESIRTIKEAIARLTMEGAEKLVAERFGKQDHERMVEEFIEKLRSLN